MYMRHSRGLKAYLRAQQPKISEKQQKKRVEFYQKKRKWMAKDFGRVIWIDESIFELEHPFNSQNDHIWAKEKASIPPRLVSMHPAKIMVWGAMRAQLLADLHVVPRSSLWT